MRYIPAYVFLTILHNVAPMDELTRKLLTPLRQYGESCGFDACPTPVSGALNVHVVAATHAEVGVQRTFPEHYTGNVDLRGAPPQSVRNMKGIYDAVITELWAEEQRTFTVTDMAYFFQWWAQRDETVRRMVYQLIRQGRLWLAGGGWSEVHEPTVSYHAFIDQLTYCLRKINATLLECARPLTSWQGDTFGHSRELASLFSQAGYAAHYISPISYYEEMKRMQDQDLEMLWRGSDDLGQSTDMFTHKLFDGITSPPGFCFGQVCEDERMFISDTIDNNRRKRAHEFIHSVLHRQGPHYGSHHVLVVMGQRFGYFDAKTWFANIDLLMESVHGYSNDTVVMQYSSPACYAHAVNSARVALPIEQGDFVPVHIDRTSVASGAFTSRPNVKYIAREGHFYAQMTKQLPVLAGISSDNKVYEDMNWILGVWQDHNILSGFMSDRVMCWYVQRLCSALQAALGNISNYIDKLRQCPYRTPLHRCRFNESVCELTQGSNYFIAIYNPLAWSVTIPVRLPIVGLDSTYTILNPSLYKEKFVILRIPRPVMDMPGRGTVQVPDHELVFLATIPPLGYMSYLIETDKMIERRSIFINKKNMNKKYFNRQDSNVNKKDANIFEEMRSVNVKKEKRLFNDTISLEKMRSFNVKKEKRLFNDTVSPVEVTTENIETTIIEEGLTIEDIPEENYIYVESKDDFISNQYVKILLDENRHVTAVKLSNGVTVSLTIHMYFYVSDDPMKFRRSILYKTSGPPSEEPQDTQVRYDFDPSPHISRPFRDDPQPVGRSPSVGRIPRVEVLKTDLVEEVHVVLSDYASYVLRLYSDQPVIEVRWLVGPIPLDKLGLGKEVFIRYDTDLNNGEWFYTDSNGRQTMRRRRNTKDTTVRSELPTTYVPGNLYPVTSKIHIEDELRNLRFAVFNDRAQGGTSLNQGQIDLMLHRRIPTNVGVYKLTLNETVFGQPMRAAGTHYLYLSKLGHKPHRMFEKKFAKEVELSPRVLVTLSNPYAQNTRAVWSRAVNQFSGIREGHRLPIGVHLLTLQEWNGDTLLIRLENYLEKADVAQSGIKTVQLTSLLRDITISSVEEMTLDGSRRQHAEPMLWSTRDGFYADYKAALGGNMTRVGEEHYQLNPPITNLSLGITLKPQQIRTFVAKFHRGEDKPPRTDSRIQKTDHYVPT